MKKLSLLISVLLISMSSMAQMYLWQGGHYSPAELDSITFSSDVETDNVFTVAPSMLSLETGETAKIALRKNTQPESSYYWSSSIDDVAIVNQQGNVSALQPGMAIISATLGFRSQTCILTVTTSSQVKYITIAKAIEIANALEPKASTSESYELRGKVTKVQTVADKLASYGNINFELTDNTSTINCFYINYLNNEKFTSADQILAVGDSVVVISPLKNYVNNSGTSVPEAANGYLKAIVKGSTTPDEGITYEDGEISVSAALAEGAKLGAGDTTAVMKVRGIVKSVKGVDLSYGTAQFYITENGTNELYCYNIKGLNGDKFVSGRQISVGDTVTIEARLYNYVKDDVSTFELIQGNITRTTNTFDPSIVEGPKVLTVAEAYAEGEKMEQGSTTLDQYKVTGIITEVTEASSQYGNITFMMKDADGTQEMIAYRLKYIDNQKYTGEPAITIGDAVTVIAQIKNHYGTIEFVNGYINEHVR